MRTLVTPMQLRWGTRPAIARLKRMVNLRRWWWCLLLWLPGLAVAQVGATVKTDEVQAQLVAHAPDGVAPGKPLWLGLLIRHAPEWHTYWKNPGDSGLPTTLNWKLPTGVSAGAIEWPTPKRLPVGPAGQLRLRRHGAAAGGGQRDAAFQGERLDVGLNAEWLVCKEVCIPQSGEFRLSVPAAASTVAHADAFDSARASKPPRAVDATHAGAGRPAGAVAAHRRVARRAAGQEPARVRRRCRRDRPRRARRAALGGASGCCCACRCRRSAARRRRRCSWCCRRRAMRRPSSCASRWRTGRRSGARRAPAAVDRGDRADRCTAGCVAGGFALLFAFVGGAAAQPDALRVPGAVAQGDRLRAARASSAGCAWPAALAYTRRRGAVVRRAGRRDAGAARRRRRARLGLSAAVAGCSSRRWRCCSR